MTALRAQMILAFAVAVRIPSTAMTVTFVPKTLATRIPEDATTQRIPMAPLADVFIFLRPAKASLVGLFSVSPVNASGIVTARTVNAFEAQP
jgi:hypothetical protein